jgi:hypothetical protein
MSSTPAEEAGGRVVVGVNGSHDSTAALGAAVRAAELLEATPVVVTTWLQPPSFGRPPVWLPDLRIETEQTQRALLQEVLVVRDEAHIPTPDRR